MLFCFKVKGQKSTYKFDKLPYEYNPGVTRRRRTASYGWKISTSPNHGLERGNYSFPRHLNSAAHSCGADDGICGGVMPPSARRSSQFTSLQPKTQIWFPEESRASQNECERRCVNNWGTSESAAPESRNQSARLLAEEQSSFGNVTPSPATHSRSFVTPQTFHSSSDLRDTEQNASHEVSSSFVCARNPESSRFTYPLNVVQQNSLRNDTPSAVMKADTYASVTPESSHSRSPLCVVERNVSRNDTPSAAMYAETFASVTPESSYSRSPLYVVENNASHNSLPSGLTYSSVYVTNRVPFFPPVHSIPYLPLMYVVPVPYEHLPVITSVTGNYSGHPSQDK